jgi:hypothetical protein
VSQVKPGIDRILHEMTLLRSPNGRHVELNVSNPVWKGAASCWSPMQYVPSL